MHFEVQTAVGVAERSEATQRQIACVEGDLGGVGLHDEDIVNVCTGGGQFKGCGHIAGEFIDVSERDAAVIDRQVVLGSELGGGAGDGGAVTDVEVAKRSMSMENNGRYAGGRLSKSKSLPVVGDVDNGLFTLITDKLHLVFHGQDGRRITLFAGRVPDAHLHGTGVILLAVDVAVFEQQSVTVMTLDSVGTIEDALAPTLLTTMQSIDAIILSELVLLPVQVLDQTVLDSVGNTADGGAIVCSVVLLVVLLSRETQHDILSADAEFLDDRSQGEESEFSLFRGGHIVIWGRNVEEGKWDAEIKDLA